MKTKQKRDLRISSDVRETIKVQKPLFSTLDDAIKLRLEADSFSLMLNNAYKDKYYDSISVYFFAVLHRAYQDVLSFYLANTNDNLFKAFVPVVKKSQALSSKIKKYDAAFPSKENKTTPDDEKIRALFLHSIFDDNTALQKELGILIKSKNFDYKKDVRDFNRLFTLYLKKETFGKISGFDTDDIASFLKAPQNKYPDSLEKQIEYILEHWRNFLSSDVLMLLEKVLLYYKERHRPFFSGPGKAHFGISTLEGIEAYTPDKDWMPNVVMMAKNTLVWLSQLSAKYGREIRTLDAIPDEELDFLRDSGFTALWLIGLWNRSPASKTIKRLCGNADAESSAYSLYDYNISYNLGGEDAIQNLKWRCEMRGIRLASDMVPNHTGLDSPWVMEHPEYFISQSYSPFASYTFNGPDLSPNPDIEIKIEDHYYNQSDCAVTFLRRDKRNGDTRFIFHGNDGTSMPWNDTAQLDYLNSATRQAVSDVIMRVARDFHIIRFDAAMTLATRHIRRLWYPAPGHAGDIPGRTDHAISDEEFASALGEEFWKTVVDRVQREMPDTLLLAEAFWMMEGYFVRSLGFHRVYNSAFMNMLRDENNSEYRQGMKATLLYDAEILQRYVNFLNNPDENAAIVGFGDGDKYFGCATLLSTLPGLPMFGHGQLEGYYEKYGMEFTSAKWDEKPNFGLLERHKREIFPLLKKRRCFSGVNDFELFDLINDGGYVEENVYAYANGYGSDRVFVFYNNSYNRASGRVKDSVQKNVKRGDSKVLVNASFADALSLKKGEKSYLKYQTLSDSLWHIYPVSKIENEGFYISLNGFETQVFQNITTVIDTYGIYKRYFDAYGLKGSLNIEEEAEDLAFSSLYKVAGEFISGDLYKNVNIALSKNSLKSTKEITTLVLSVYEKMMAVIKSDEALSSYEFDMPTSEDIEQIFRNVQILRRIKPEFTESLLSILEKKEVFFLSLLFILPFFINGKNEGKEAILSRAALRFFTYHFMKDDNEIDKNSMEIIKNHIILLLKSRKWDIDFKNILKNSDFCDFIIMNTYENTTWYNEGLYQEAIFFTFLSHLLFEKHTDAEVKALADFCIRSYEGALNSYYKVDNLYNSLSREGGNIRNEI